jgi:hypothetical protein
MTNHQIASPLQKCKNITNCKEMFMKGTNNVKYEIALIPYFDFSTELQHD